MLEAKALLRSQSSSVVETSISGKDGVSSALSDTSSRPVSISFSSSSRHSNTASIPFLLWKIIKLYFSYSTLHSSSSSSKILYETLLYEICEIFSFYEIPFNSFLFLKLHYFINKCYQQSIPTTAGVSQVRKDGNKSDNSFSPRDEELPGYEDEADSDREADFGVESNQRNSQQRRERTQQQQHINDNKVKETLTSSFILESVIMKFIINTIYSSKQNNSLQFLINHRNEEKRKKEKSSLKQKKEGTTTATIAVESLSFSDIEEYYSRFLFIPSNVSISCELTELSSFLFEGSELFLRSISRHYSFLQSSLSFMNVYVSYFLPSFSSSSASSTSSSSSAASLSSSTSLSNLDSLYSLIYYFQIVFSYLIKTNEKYLFSSKLLKRLSKELFTPQQPVMTRNEEKDSGSPREQIGKVQDNSLFSSIRSSYRPTKTKTTVINSKEGINNKNKLSSSPSSDSIGSDREIIKEQSGGEEDLLTSSSSSKKRKKQKKQQQQKQPTSGKKRFTYELIEDEGEIEVDTTEPEDTVQGIKGSESSTKRKKESSISSLTIKERQVENIIFLIYRVFLQFVNPLYSCYQFEFNANLSKTIEILLEKSLFLEKHLFFHYSTFSSTSGFPLSASSSPTIATSPISSPIRPFSSKFTPAALVNSHPPSPTGSLTGNGVSSPFTTNTQRYYHKYYQLQYFYYFNFLLLEIMIAKIPMNYSSLILFSSNLKDQTTTSSLDTTVNPSDSHHPLHSQQHHHPQQQQGQHLHQPQHQHHNYPHLYQPASSHLFDLTVSSPVHPFAASYNNSSSFSDDSSSSLIFTKKTLFIIHTFLKSFNEMECYQQILLFVIRLLSKVSNKLTLSNHLLPAGSSTGPLSSFLLFPDNNLKEEKDAVSYSHLIQELFSYALAREEHYHHPSVVGDSGGNDNESTVTVHSRNQQQQQRTHYQKQFLFYPFSIMEFHSFLSMIFNHLMNFSIDYYIPKLVFYWNLHVSDFF
jgi:hypothetical protein